MATPEGFQLGILPERKLDRARFGGQLRLVDLSVDCDG